MRRNSGVASFYEFRVAPNTVTEKRRLDTSKTRWSGGGGVSRERRTEDRVNGKDGRFFETLKS